MHARGLWAYGALAICALAGCVAEGARPDPEGAPSTEGARPDGTPEAAALPGGKTAFVQLFEWKWTDVARECETFLGPKGFAAVQISPPEEHAWVTSGDGAPFPWWMRSQPVSYRLDRSRSGTRAEFV